MSFKKILVVDDEIDVINSMRTVLESEGHKVIDASNKEDGFKLAKSEMPNLAILDVMMNTHYEGFELAENLANDPDCKHIPILMYTSIEVLTTSEDSVREMAREFRKNPAYKELQVILVKDTISGKAGIDYRTEDGKEVWIPVKGFLNKPAEPSELLKSIKTLFFN